MNIGILTYHWVSNFGANLQTLSTYKYIESTGNNPVIIDWIPEDLENYYSKCVAPEQNEMHHSFASHYFVNRTQLCRNSEDIAKEIVANDIKMVLIGSDAVFTYQPYWSRFSIGRRGVHYSKPYIDSDFPNPFWGEFVDLVRDDVIIVAMSASAQNTPYTKIKSEKRKRAFEKALGKFSFLSVRDVWTQKMLSYLTHNKVLPTITPDPVFAFNQNVRPSDTKEYICKKYNLSENYALFSSSNPCNHFTDEWLHDLSDRFADNSIELVELPKTLQATRRLDRYISFPIPPMDWYNLIKFSQGYIGELMHPVLVSLHNAVPVFALDTYGFTKGGKLDIESSKTYQIMNRFNLLDNYYNRLYNTAIPSPLDVSSRILGFDREECEKESLSMYKSYLGMMNNIMSLTK